MMRSEGRTPQIHSFCAMNSLSMSFWIVPRSASGGDPAPLGDHDVKRQQHDGGRVDGHRRRHLGERDVGEQPLDVGDRRDRNPFAPDLAARRRIVGIEAHQRGHIERGRKARLPVRQQVAKPAVGVFRRAEAREHAHRPRLAAVHRFVGAARERKAARRAQALRRVPVGAEVLGRVNGRQRQARLRLGGGRIFGINPNGFAVKRHRSTCRVSLPVRTR